MDTTYREINKQNLQDPSIEWGDNLLHFLSRWHYSEPLKLALTYPNNLDCQNNFGQTPLIAAAHACYCDEYIHEEYFSVFELLISSGATIEAEDKLGWSAIRYLLSNFIGIYSYDHESGKVYYGSAILDRSQETKMKILKLFLENEAGSGFRAILNKDIFRKIISEKPQVVDAFNSLGVSI